MSNPVFWEKNKKKCGLSSAEFTQGLVKVTYIRLLTKQILSELIETALLKKDIPYVLSWSG